MVLVVMVVVVALVMMVGIVILTGHIWFATMCTPKITLCTPECTPAQLTLDPPLGRGGV